MNVEIKITRDDGKVMIQMVGSANSPISWEARPPDSELVDEARSYLLYGFYFMPRVKYIVEKKKEKQQNE
jgi:hypothetical protein